MNKNLKDIMKNIKTDASIPSIKIDGLATNTDRVKKNYIFFAMKGINHNGNDFIHIAFKKGASVVLTQDEIFPVRGKIIIRVENIKDTVALIASNFYDNSADKLFIIGVTGTNGKTSVCSLLHSILNSANIKCSQIGTLGIRKSKLFEKSKLTTPEAIDLHKHFYKLKKENYTHVVMEVSSHSIHQKRIFDIKYDVAIYTNLSKEHLDYHKSMMSYFKTKLSLFVNLSKNSTAVINGSDKYGMKINDAITSKKRWFSIKNQRDTYFDKININRHGILGTIKTKKDFYNIKSKLIGKFNAENILAAVCCASEIGIDKKSIEKGILNCPPIPGRMETFTLSSGTTVIIDYAHTPDAYEKSLNVIKTIKDDKGKIYIVFGAGGERDRYKRSVMGSIAEKYCSHSFIAPDNPRGENLENINSDIISGYLKEENYSIFNDRAEALHCALKKAKRNDSVAIFGKGREEYQEVKDKRYHHSDLEIVREYQ